MHARDEHSSKFPAHYQILPVRIAHPCSGGHVFGIFVMSLTSEHAKVISTILVHVGRVGGRRRQYSNVLDSKNDRVLKAQSDLTPIGGRTSQRELVARARWRLELAVGIRVELWGLT